MNDDPRHPIPVGEIVTVINVVDADPPFMIEGRGMILSPAHGRHRYWLQFLGDPRIRERLVHPAFQNDSDAVLSWLIELWHASREPDLREFFPDSFQTHGESR